MDMPIEQKPHKMPVYIVTELDSNDYPPKIISSEYKTRSEVDTISFRYDTSFETDDKGDFTTQLRALHTLNKVIIITRIDILIQTQCP